MDIKSNHWTARPLSKLICSLVVVACLILGSQMFASYYVKSRELSPSDWNSYQYTTYSEESYGRSMVYDWEETARTIIRYQSEDSIKNPENYNISRSSSYEENDYQVTSKLSGREYWTDTPNDLIPIVSNELNDFYTYQTALEQSGMNYYIVVGNTTYGDPNAPGNSRYALETKNSRTTYFPEEAFSRVARYSYEPIENTYLYLGTNAEEYSAVRQLQEQRARMETIFYLSIGITAFVGCVALLFLTLGAGRRTADAGKGIYLLATDKIPLDLGALLIGMVSAFAIQITERLLRLSAFEDWLHYHIFGLVLVIFPFLLAIVWYLSLVRLFKAGKWWRNTVLWKFFHLFGRSIGAVFSKLWNWWLTFNYKARLLLLFVIVGFAGFLLVMESGFSLLVLPLIFLVLFFYYRNLDRLKKGMAAIEAGDFDGNIPIRRGELAPLARSLEEISQNLDTQVQQRLQSELYKTELITNVSHDLRTPLTSLITYTDLLKTKGLDSPEAPEYLDILIQKSNRLKLLTDDLFEATKAATGNTEVHLETLNLAQLARQWLGEFDQQIRESQLEFVADFPEDAYVTADGNLMWRVLENLMSNTLKYSLRGTRVYVDLLELEESYCLEMKNISHTPLNIPVEELMHRFQRGDASRSTEGSGLGLSIVQSFIEAQQGLVGLSVDGDLFKATICLPKADSPTTE